VLRYWEQEFTQLKPMKRRGNRRYYQHHEVLLIRRIRELLYEQGFTISGARNRLSETSHGARAELTNGRTQPAADEAPEAIDVADSADSLEVKAADTAVPVPEVQELSVSVMRRELISILGLLTVEADS